MAQGACLGLGGGEHGACGGVEPFERHGISGPDRCHTVKSMIRITLVTGTGSDDRGTTDQSAADDVLARWDAALDTAEWVTLPEAAAAAGVSVSALRAWYRAGDVPSRMERGPHGQQRLVQLEEVLERAARSRRTGTA